MECQSSFLINCLELKNTEKKGHYYDFFFFFEKEEEMAKTFQTSWPESSMS